MNATPHKHAEKIKQWADAPEWWDVYCLTPERKNWQKAGAPVWMPEAVYKLEKSTKHPDNIKPKKRLLGWSKMPRGTMTNCGIVLGVSKDGHVRVLITNEDYSCLYRPRKIRLAEQTQFTYWGGGECPVPEGVVVEIVSRSGDTFTDQYLNNAWKHRKVDGDIIAYRIIGLADGWTDVPEEAA